MFIVVEILPIPTFYNHLDKKISTHPISINLHTNLFRYNTIKKEIAHKVKLCRLFFGYILELYVPVQSIIVPLAIQLEGYDHRKHRLCG